MNTFLPATAAALLCLCLTLTQAAPAPAPASADAREDLERALAEQLHFRFPQKEMAEQNRVFPRPIFGLSLPQTNKKTNMDVFMQAVASAAVRDLLKAAAAEGAEEKASMERVPWKTIGTALSLLG